MDVNLRDKEGDLTALARALRSAGLIVAILTGLAAALFTPLALLSPMRCDSGCAPIMHLAVTGVLFSPFLLGLSALSGLVAFKNPSWGLFALTFIPAAVVAIAFVSSGFV